MVLFALVILVVFSLLALLILSFSLQLKKPVNTFGSFCAGVALAYIILMFIVGVLTLMYKIGGYSMKKLDDSSFYQEVKEPLYRKMPLPK